jgi:DNA-binding CsgD family transcriptional regulator
VRDVGSRNGTFVNGQRLWQEQALRDGDEIRAGGVRLVYRTGTPARPGPSTAPQEKPLIPQLTRREREVLVLLCRPVLAGPFTEPASTNELAEALVVTEPAVKQHLLHLYDKFDIHGQGERRRARLANEAVRRGVVSLADLRDQTLPA